MSEKRRDNRGRILHNGEAQRADGRYSFAYTDITGKRRFIYSNRLDKNDRTPAGSKRDLSLREKEAELMYKRFSGIADCAKDMTVYELAEKYVSLKIGVRESTKAGYRTVLRILEKERFGHLPIDKVRVSDAKAWLVKLQQEDGRGYSSIHSIRGVVRPAFQMAVEDEILHKNRFCFELHTVLVNDSKTRDAITRKQEREFLQFVKEDKHFSKYYEGFYILFHTGLRISEFCALTPADIDFKNRCIHVKEQLVRHSNMITCLEPTKTEAGIRDVPMSDEVIACFKTILKNRRQPVIEPVIDGKAGFLYLDMNGRPLVALHWENYFRHVTEKYNKLYKVQLPKITPHVCRHTFCSNMAKSGMSPKTLQYIMGHTDIAVTMNTYTHLKAEDAQAEFHKLFDDNEAKRKARAAT